MNHNISASAGEVARQLVRGSLNLLPESLRIPFRDPFYIARDLACEQAVTVIVKAIDPVDRSEALGQGFTAAEDNSIRNPKLNRGTRKERGLQAASTSTTSAIHERPKPCGRRSGVNAALLRPGFGFARFSLRSSGSIHKDANSERHKV